MIQLYCGDIRTLPQNTEQVVQCIQGERRKKAEHYVKEEDKRRSVAASLLLSFALDKKIHADWQFRYNQYQKPFLKGERCFNISHSGDYVLLALGNKDLGVDIECHKSYDYERLAKVSFAIEEQVYINNSLQKESDFYKLWTLKESFMKAHGTGFHLPSKQFYFTFPQDNSIALHTSIPNTYTFTVLDCVSGYTIAVCGREPLNHEIKWINFTAYLQNGRT